ncbi:unnamed protein product [Bursaphelenchus xylophilus]|uniref:(pine wood nematode) hypothetical protein n=1 Tax=Bursaphelenchus xylophilus TaxID=6326 RepID=A0A811M9L7_BURXY|nr:unnamed protein product [Bursaphelenchus xylophilus]CAG9132238.1 unnamed protein product [Bursaphelenchus xylophilus]
MSNSTSTETSTLSQTRQSSKNINQRVLITVNVVVALVTAFHLGFRLIYADFIGFGPIFQQTEDLHNKTSYNFFLEHFSRPESPLYTNITCILGAVIIVAFSTKFAKLSLRYCLIWAIAASVVGVPFAISTFIWQLHWLQTAGLCLSDLALVISVCFQICIVQDLSNNKFKKIFTFFTGLFFALGTFVSCIVCLVTVDFPKIRLTVYLGIFLFSIPAIVGLLVIPDSLFFHIEQDEKLNVLDLLSTSLSTENPSLQRSYEFYHDSKMSAEDGKLIYTRAVAKCAYDGFLYVWLDKNGRTVALLAITTNVLGAVCDHMFSLRWYIHQAYITEDSYTALFTITFAFLLGSLLAIPVALLLSRRCMFVSACVVLLFCEIGHAITTTESMRQEVGFDISYRMGVFLRVLQTIISGATFSTHAWTIGAELAPRNIQVLVTSMGISCRFFASEAFILLHVASSASKTFIMSPLICIVLIVGAIIISFYMPKGNGFFNMYSWWMNMSEDIHALRHFNQNKQQLCTNYNYSDALLNRCRRAHMRVVESVVGSKSSSMVSKSEKSEKVN